MSVGDVGGVGVENAVGVYVDGVYQSRATAETMQFIDVDRVEVLKGPQGVLYGRNATGGAINIVSKAPSHESEAIFELQAGSNHRQLARGTLSGSLSEGAAYGRLSVLHNHEGGDTTNLLLKRRVNGSDVDGLRGALELKPSGTFDLTLRASYYHSESSPIAKAIHPDVNPLFTVFHAAVLDDPRAVMQNRASDLRLTTASLGATAIWQLDGTTFTSVTAFNKTDFEARRGDLDGTEIPLLQVGVGGVPETSHFFSQEFTLASAGKSSLTWLALLSYQHEKAESLGWNLNSPLTRTSTGSTALIKTDALGIAAQASYALNDRWRITGGARYSQEAKDLDALRTYTNGMLTGSMSDRKKWSAVTPKLVVDYSPDRSSMYYLSATKGFKSGGFNTLAIQPGFDPETAVSLEAGFKGKWFGDRLSAQVAAFATRYEDMQIAVALNGASIIKPVTENAGRAVSRGIEGSLRAKPTERIELFAAVQFLKARFAEFVSLDPHFPSVGPQDWKDNPLPRAPDTTASLAIQYAWPVRESGGQMNLRVENDYRSKIYFTPFKNDYATSAGVSVWNAMLSYESARPAGWFGSVFVKNITNRTYATSIFDPQGLGYLAHFAPGRTAGIQIGLRY
jgi:iron complex outermembrane recepter protein